MMRWYGCHPRCYKRCVGVFTHKYKIYQKCCYEVVMVCPHCGFEYDCRRYFACPRCGMHHMHYMMDDPPMDPPEAEWGMY